MPDAYDRLESPPDLGPQLRALPQLAPRESALPGLMLELAARRRRRALAWLVPAAAAALMVLAVLPALKAPPSTPATAPEQVAVAPQEQAPDPRLAGLMQANAVLEQRLATIRAEHITQDGDAAQASSQMEDMIVMVDAALGSDPAPDARLRLWQRRYELLQALNQVQRQGSFAPAQDGRVYLASF